jgi:outer membrane receptor protein involved in Fe transport
VSVEAATAPIAALTLSAGARHEWRSAPVSGTAWLGATVARASAAYQVQPSITLRASGATSHRWPTLNELARDFSAGSTSTLANANLLPERARSMDAGIDVSGHGFQVSVTGFRSVVLDAIANVTQSSSATAIVRQRRNAGEAHSTGVEIDGEWQNSLVRLRASMTFLDAKFRNSQEAALEGNWLPQVPKRSVALTADLLLPQHHTVSFVMHDVSTQFDDDRNQFLLAGATQVDARLAGRYRAFGWQLSFENLTDARLETGRTPLVALAQGRAVRFGVTIGK